MQLCSVDGHVVGGVQVELKKEGYCVAGCDFSYGTVTSGCRTKTSTVYQRINRAEYAVGVSQCLRRRVR